MPKVDILAIGAHPDDIEIFMGGSLLAFKKQGKRVGGLDLTQGEAGTYGSRSTRLKERDKANRVLKLDWRESLDFPDGRVTSSRESQLPVIKILRELRPEIIFTFAGGQRHPDHRQTGELVQAAWYLSGLKSIKTAKGAHRASSLVFFPELLFYEKPDFIIDITPFWKDKLRSIRAYNTQVSVKKSRSNPHKTLIKSAEFWEILEARARLAGAAIGTRYGESFFSPRPPRLDNPLAAFAHRPGK